MNNIIKRDGNLRSNLASRGLTKVNTRVTTVSWMVVGVALIVWGLRIWGSATSSAIAPVPAFILTGVGLAGLVVPPLLRNETSWRRWEYIVLVAFVGALLVWASTQILADPSYLTDEMAFDQWAATLWMHGINPYGRSLAAAFTAFHVSPDRYTWTLTGRPVTLLSYPALAFELYMPALIFGWTSHMAVWLNVGAWALGIVLAFIAVPRSFRPWVIILGSLSVYAGFAEGGVTDALYVPFLVLAAWGWDKYPLKNGWQAAWPAIWMGLAMGVKQTPWILWPFLVMGFVMEARRLDLDWISIRRMVLRYTIISGAVFLIPNIPFIVLNPGSWFSGVLAPLISKTVPDGQGLITLTMFEPWAGGSIKLFTFLSVFVLLSLLVLYPLVYPRLKAATFLLPSVALFFATRSFASYLLMLLPAALVAVATTKPLHNVSLGKRAVQIVWGVGGISAILAILAVAWPTPLQLSVLSIHTSGELATVDRVTLRVKNNADTTLHPRFTANVNGSYTSFWHMLNGPSEVGPHGSAVYTIAPNDFGAMPPVTGGFQIVAFTPLRQTISRTKIIQPNTWHLAVTPDAINKTVAIGKILHFKFQILNQWDQPVHISGIPVYMGQVVYAQRGAESAFSVIDHGYDGETPMSTVTNSQGVAVFSVRDVSAQSNPVSYEANLVNAQDNYPYGFSTIVPVRYGS